MVQLYEERLKEMDCLRRGWILIDFPSNREQALALQSRGICAKHVGKVRIYVFSERLLN